MPGESIFKTSAPNFWFSLVFSGEFALKHFKWGATRASKPSNPAVSPVCLTPLATFTAQICTCLDMTRSLGKVEVFEAVQGWMAIWYGCFFANQPAAKWWILWLLERNSPIKQWLHHLQWVGEVASELRPCPKSWILKLSGLFSVNIPSSVFYLASPICVWCC